MTTINPELLFEVLKQKINWGTMLTPVRRIGQLVESYNTLTGKTLLIDGSQLVALNLTNECKDKVDPKDEFKSLDLTPTTKTVVAVLKDVCLVKSGDETLVRVKMDLNGFDKKLMELIPDKGTEKDVLSNLKSANKTITQYATFSLGKNTLDPQKKDILGLLFALLKQEYEKSSVKDGELKQTNLNEHSIILSDKQKFIDIVDVTNATSDPKLCDVKDNVTTNAITLVNIKSYRMLDQGKSFCVDLDYHRYYQQQRILTVNTVNPSKSAEKEKGMDEMDDHDHDHGDMNDKKTNEKGKEMMDSGKKTVLDSFIANYLSQAYADIKKWNIEWMRIGENIIFLKATNIENKESIFYKFDITYAVSDASKCPEKSSMPSIREFVYLDKFCKKDTQYKLQFNLVGSEVTAMNGMVVPFASLKESKTSKELQDFIDSMNKNNNVKKAYFASGFFNPYRGLFGVGYGAGYGLGCGGYGLGCGGYGSVVGYPGFGIGYNAFAPTLSTVVAPPLSVAVAPTAPLTIAPPLSVAVAPPVVSSYGSYGYASPPVVSSYGYGVPTLGAYSYPSIVGSTYPSYGSVYGSAYGTGLGSVYSPLSYGLGYGVGYTPNLTLGSYFNNYSYIVKAPNKESSEVLIRNQFVAPSKVSSLRELDDILSNNTKSVQIEKISNQFYKVEFENNLLFESHIYSFNGDGLYRVKTQEKRLL
jgi:hypothetical protein